MPKPLARIGLSLALIAAAPIPVPPPSSAPPPTLLAGFTRDPYGMCHKPGGAYVACNVAAPPFTMQCKDGAFSTSKIVKTGCNAHGGMRKVL